ncbi:MAG: hypothetical protein ACLTMQ_03200 [Acutalibacteraceae bacterium]
MYPNPYRTRGLPRTLSANTKGFFDGLIGQKNPENDTEMIQNYRRYRHTSGNGRKERTHAKNEQETAAGMVFFPAASESREYHLRPYHIQRPLPGLYP